MILFFNKQFREENGIINDLAKKIKKSKILERKTQGNTEIYTLDNITVSFDILNHKLVVAEKKTGEHVLDMNCDFVQTFSEADELQNARFHMFSRLLEAARKTYEKNAEKAKQLSTAAEELRKKQALFDITQREEKAVKEAIAAARKRLKSL